MLGVSVWVWLVAIILGSAIVLIIMGGSLKDNPALRPPVRRDGDGVAKVFAPTDDVDVEGGA